MEDVPAMPHGDYKEFASTDYLGRRRCKIPQALPGLTTPMPTRNELNAQTRMILGLHIYEKPQYSSGTNSAKLRLSSHFLP